MPSVTAISSGVRSPRQSPCTPQHLALIDPKTQFPLQRRNRTLALRCAIARSCRNTYVCSLASVRAWTYRYEHMFPRRNPSPLTRRAQTALSLARSFLLLEDDYVRDWEVASDEQAGRDRSKIDGISERPAHERASVAHPPVAHPSIAHPHRVSLRGRSARVRAGQPTPASHACVSPIERSVTSATVRRVAATKTGRPQATRS